MNFLPGRSWPELILAGTLMMLLYGPLALRFCLRAASPRKAVAKNEDGYRRRSRVDTRVGPAAARDPITPFRRSGRIVRYVMHIGGEGLLRDFSGDLRISRTPRSGRQMPDAAATA